MTVEEKYELLLKAVMKHRKAWWEAKKFRSKTYADIAYRSGLEIDKIVRQEMSSRQQSEPTLKK